jgi:PmbA protein
MPDEKNIFSLANIGLKFAEKKSTTLQCAELFINESRYLNIEIEENSIKNSETGFDQGVSIRVVDKRGSLGFTYTNNIKQKAIEKIIVRALKMMNAGTGDPDFKDFPSIYTNYPRVKNLVDKELKNIQIDGALPYIKELINACDNDDLAISQSAGFTSNYSKTYIFNTNGLEISGQDTLCTITSNIIVKDPITKDTSFGYEWQSDRSLKNISASETAKNSLKNAKKNLNRKKIKSRKVPIILTPTGTISFILAPIAAAINAESVQYKRSFLVGKLYKIIGSEYLSVDDNALINGAAGSSSFDGEGVPCKNKPIFKEGKFLNIIHNSYTAGKDGIESTGNAARGSYSSVPSIGITNLILQPGDFKKDEMIQEISDGIILDYTGDSPNITTGDFSGLILQGNVIKNGEIKEPLNETMFGVNLIDLFKNIDAISKEFKTYGAFHAPFVKIKELQIIGARG